MDKIVNLKKAPVQRKKNAEMPEITYEKTMHLLGCYFVHSSFSPEDKKKSELIRSEINKKRTSYKTQDMKKKKYCERTFITEEQIYNKMLGSRMLCYYCRCRVCVLYREVRQPEQWTLERIDNLFGHTDENTVIACLDCNLKRGSKNSDAFQFAKQMVIKKI